MSDTDLIPVTSDDHGPGQVVVYTNHRGETAERTITPIKVWLGMTEWYPYTQYLIHAWDHDKQAYRDFALSGFGYPAPEKPITSKEILERAGMDGPFEVGPFPPEERQKPTLPEKPDSSLREAVVQRISGLVESRDQIGAFELADAAIAVVVERCAAQIECLLPEQGAGEPQDATDRLIDVTRREDARAVRALARKEG